MPIPGPSHQQQASEPVLPPVSPTLSELKLEWGLFPSDPEEEAEVLCQEGGVVLLSFLTAKAISPTANTATDLKTWVYHNVTHLPQLEQDEWQQTCLRELEALRDCKVFDLVEHPCGHKVIKTNGYLMSSLMDTNTPD